MLASKVTPILRRAISCTFPVLAVVCACAVSAQVTNTQNTNEFSSSNQALIASNDNPGTASLAAEPEAPSPSLTPDPAAGQAGGAYGSGGHGYWNWSHFAFEAGGGANAPIGNDQPFITWGGNFTVGAGLRVNPHVSGLIEYQFIDDKLPGSLIADAGAQGGHAHIWSLTLDPVIDFFPSHKMDAYVTGGGGFYRKVTSFTDPQQVEQCYYFCVIGTENVVVSHFSSNQGGANFGFGLTRKVGGMNGDSNMKLFAEARYLWISTPGLDKQDGLGETELIPVTFGVRW